MAYMENASVVNPIAGNSTHWSPNGGKGTIRGSREFECCHEISKCKVGLDGWNDQVQRYIITLLCYQLWEGNLSVWRNAIPVGTQIKV